jgi:hypothetical protein
VSGAGAGTWAGALRGRHGFLMITVLMLSLVLFTMGIAFLGSRSGLYQSSYRATLASQARALARAGLEDARAKLDKDAQFPPPGANQQNTYNYDEDVIDLVSGVYLGSYRVTLDNTANVTPYNVLKITSAGFAGPRSAPLASHIYTAYLDTSTTSPYYFQLVRFEDDGAL